VHPVLCELGHGGYADVYMELEELVYAEALRYYSQGRLGRLRALYERAARLGVDYTVLEDVEELIWRLEERLLQRMGEALGGVRAW